MIDAILAQIARDDQTVSAMRDFGTHVAEFYGGLIEADMDEAEAVQTACTFQASMIAANLSAPRDEAAQQPAGLVTFAMSVVAYRDALRDGGVPEQHLGAFAASLFASFAHRSRP